MSSSNKVVMYYAKNGRSQIISYFFLKIYSCQLHINLLHNLFNWIRIKLFISLIQVLIAEIFRGKKILFSYKTIKNCEHIASTWILPSLIFDVQAFVF